MPVNKYNKILIDGQEVEVESIQDINVSISYALEDKDNFQTKTSSKAFNVNVPATIRNDRIANTFHNPGIEDLTAGQVYRKSRRGIIIAGGQEVLVGKAFLKKGSHTNKPTSYVWDFYGDNGDWLIDLKESTLWDFFKDINFTLTKSLIVNSWAFDGTDPNLPYVFAPVRYADPLATLTDIQDYDMRPEYMRPSLSKYWCIYNAFKSLGYKIKSDFMDTEYFRRQVMPWTWGNFLLSPGTRLDNLDFLAKSASEFKHNGDYEGNIDLHVTNDSTNGAFDNNGVYDYDAGTQQMRFTYIPAFSSYGLLSATFHIAIFFNASVSSNSGMTVRLAWYKNGVKLDNGGNDDGVHGKVLFGIYSQNPLQTKQFIDISEDWMTVQIMPTDVITARVWIDKNDSATGSARLTATVDAFELDYFKIPIGGHVDFTAYDNLKKYKFLDFLAGVVDEFNLCMKTDTLNKIVYFEPEHEYSLVNDQSDKSGGYFNNNTLDWSKKQDLSQESDVEQFSDYERELSFKYKDDDNDGTFKTVKDRMGGTPALGKYVFPERFKAGKREVENRFFSVVMHYNAVQWKNLGTRAGDSPQMICLIPENISNTSADEAQNTFLPKSAYYKGVVPDWGWVFDGQVMNNHWPFMFAVNYKNGGQEDPILSYCDEQIGTNVLKVTGVGLVRRFYLQRLAIMDNGEYYRTWFRLNNNDIANFMHREHIICRGQRWEVVEIANYMPFKDEATSVYLRKWSPIKNA